MDRNAALRFARQISLPELGPDGQQRICDARVVVAGGGLAAEVAALYLRAAGVGTVIELRELPDGGEAWLAALDGADLVVRSGFDDDAMLAAAKRLGLPAVVARAQLDSIDVASMARRPPAPETPLDVPTRISPRAEGSTAVAAGTLAAAEALQTLVRETPAPGFARHLRLPFDGSDPLSQVIGPR
jgi:hypothetical protein